MSDAREQTVETLVASLGSGSGRQRHHARKTLVEVGRPAVPLLLGALEANERHVRWEAAKTLAAIADPGAAERLVDALGDKDADVRWVVAEALIALGRDAVEPLLKALVTDESPQRLYRGAHHVLHDLARRESLRPLLLPVLDALNRPEPELAVPNAAEKALRDAFD